MALVIEDGTGVAGADSWATVLEADARATAMGNAGWLAADNPAKEAALRRAARFIVVVYGQRFPGSRTYGLDQSLPWPRTGVDDEDGIPFDDDYIPPALKEAQVEAGFRELTSPGSLTPTTAPQIKKSVTVGPISVDYAEGSTTGFVDIIEGLLLPILDSAAGASVKFLQRA